MYCIPMQEFPQWFVRTHGMHFRPHFRVQGVHEDSPIYNMNSMVPKGWDGQRLGFQNKHWNAFVEDNELKKGQQLQFSLTGDSYFVVRKV
jgi:hypothetical protein